MKKIIALFALVMLVCGACQRDFVLKPGDWFQGPNGSGVVYRGNIGNDLESALDSLQRSINQIHPNMHFTAQKVKLRGIKFSYDRRTFWRIQFLTGDVSGDVLDNALDSKGNLYTYHMQECGN